MFEDGKQQADILIETMRQNNNPTLLGAMVRDIMTRNEYSDRDAGFVFRIAQRLIQS